jgi:hypothetical protein
MFKKLLSVLACAISLLVATNALADCPKPDSIKIDKQKDRFIATSADGTNWVSLNRTYGHKLHGTVFWRAMGLQVHKAADGTIAGVDCSYQLKDRHTFSVSAPRNKKFKIVKSPNWQKECMDRNGSFEERGWGRYRNGSSCYDATYMCIYKKNVGNCPFKVI